jgi:hypothetical protein
MNSGIRLVFHSGGGDTGIFYREEEYLRFRQIAIALRTSRTWGGFRSALPDGEFESLYHWVSNDGDYIYRDGDEFLFIEDSQIKAFFLSHGEAYVITSAAPFDPEFIGGVSDGDYPPWMSQTAVDLNLLPPGFVQDFGRRVDSLMVNDSWWVFPVEQFDEMKRRLEAAGFTVWRTHTSSSVQGW